MLGDSEMQVVGTKIAIFAAMLASVFTVNAYGAGKTMDLIAPDVPAIEPHAVCHAPLRVMDSYFGIPKENIQFQSSFEGNNGDNVSYEVVFAYTNNTTQPNTNFFNEVYIIPDYLSSKKGEEAYRVSNIVIIKELSGALSVGYMASGVRRDVLGFISNDNALVVPDDQKFAITLMRTLANDPKGPIGLKCINSKRFFENANIQYLSRSDLKGSKVHFLSEKFNR